MSRVWASFTRMIKHPTRGTRVLGKGGIVLEYNGDEWWTWCKGPFITAVMSTGKQYHYNGKRWVTYD